MKGCKSPAKRGIKCLTYNVLQETKYSIYKDLYLNSRIGRDFNISKKIGIEVDIGAVFALSHEKTIKEKHWLSGLDFNNSVLPTLGIGLYYRI